MHFVIQWLWYLLAFVVGSLVAWLIAVVAVPSTTGQALSDGSAAGEPEAR